jgi:hypothetical protein
MLGFFYHTQGKCKISKGHLSFLMGEVLASSSVKTIDVQSKLQRSSILANLASIYISGLAFFKTIVV